MTRAAQPVTAAAVPALAVACAVAERPPLVVAVRVCGPTVAPSVQVTVKRPLASVVLFWGEGEPPWPAGTAALMETPATGPWAPATLNTTWAGSTLPTLPI